MWLGCREGKDAPKAAKLLAPAVGKVLYTQAEGPRGWKVRRCLSQQVFTVNRVFTKRVAFDMPWFTETGSPSGTAPALRVLGLLYQLLSRGCRTKPCPSGLEGPEAASAWKMEGLT